MFHVKQRFRLPLIYQLHVVEHSFDRYRSGTNVIRGKKASSIGKTGGALQNRMFHVEHGLYQATDALNVDENPKCGIFYVFYREIE